MWFYSCWTKFTVSLLCSMRTRLAQAARAVQSWLTWKMRGPAFWPGPTSSKPDSPSWSSNSRSPNKRCSPELKAVEMSWGSERSVSWWRRVSLSILKPLQAEMERALLQGETQAELDQIEAETDVVSQLQRKLEELERAIQREKDKVHTAGTWTVRISSWWAALAKKKSKVHHFCCFSLWAAFALASGP